MAKRKNNKLKIKIAKNGVLYYYLKGKRLKEKEGKKIQEQQFQKRSDSAKKAAANTYKFKGRPIPRIYAVLIQKIYPNVNFIKIMDMSQWKDPKTGKPLFPRYSDILKTIDNASKGDSNIFKLLTEMGYFKDKEGRTALIDICEIIQQKEYNKFKFILINDEGLEFRGKITVCNKIREFEEYVTSEIRDALGMNVIKTYFDYSPKYDFIKKIFELDLSDNNPKVSIDEIVNKGLSKNNTLTRIEGELVIPDKVISDTGQPIKVEENVGKNKFKNVYITYSLS